MLIRSASGLRGIVKDDFSPEIIDRYIVSFIITQNIKHCVIGRDGRQSGKDISQWVIDSLTKYGVNVDNCDLATTPTMQLMTEKEQYDGGIVITASHNPSEYNGLKFLQKDGTFLSPDQCNNLFTSVDNKDTINDSKVIGKVSIYNSANEEHINKVLNAQCIESDNINSNKFKVVIDAVNGAGSDILPQLLKSLGCEVIMINCNGDGNFTRIPEPLATNLKDLENKVIEVGAGIGMYGPYILHDKKYKALEKTDNILDIELDRAIELIAKPTQRGNATLKTFGEHPSEKKNITAHDGKFGPYVKCGKINASLLGDQTIDSLTLEDAIKLIDDRKQKIGLKKKKK